MGFRHTGSAIIFAMGMSLLVAGLAVALILWLSLDIRRAEQLQLGSERLASLEIAEAMAAEKIQTLPDDWSSPWQIKNDFFKMSAQLQDLSGRLNINTLFKKEETPEANPSFMPQAVFTRLFEIMGMGEDEALIEKITQSGTALFGTSQFAELAPVKDYIYAVDPKNQAVNINTASPEVLASILDISTSLAEAILVKRPFESSKEIIDVLAENQLKYDTTGPVEAWLGVEDHYYVLESVFHGDRLMRVYSVFNKDAEKITLLWRSWGTMP